MIETIAAAFMCGVTFILVVIALICVIDRKIELSKPKRPKNIQTYAGGFLRGECPQCGYAVSNCDGRCKGGISYCPACGKKIKFPPLTPEIEGVKSITADEYEELDKKYRKRVEYYLKGERK